MPHYRFQEIGRLPAPEDNVAIAIRTLPPGTRIEYQGGELVLDHTVMEGHRFAVSPIAEGEALLSWGFPFGFACQDIAPGNYVCNRRAVEALSGRNLDISLPEAPNFTDRIDPYLMDEAGFEPGLQTPRDLPGGTFPGYQRSPDRGVGTRNYVVILGTSSRTGSFARVLAERLKGEAEPLENVDGIVAVAHTEGGQDTEPNNQELVLSTLSGFVVHPNVGAVLCVDRGTEAVTNEHLRRHLLRNGFPLGDVPHHFLTLKDSFRDELSRSERIVRDWLPRVDSCQRTSQPMTSLRLALQCGGSDAFSGISANPLSGWVARELLRQGGSANLAETDELIGAEAYVLQNARDLETARAFLSKVANFKERVAWHGESAQGNPSGGNILRGLYNIVIKSLGAATKRHPGVRLDHVIDYAQRMTEPGFYFMDSPGNDLESLAGQVASGTNLIFFTTGNGSVTNFPFVPTIKIVTTSGRFRLLSRDMDFNAGAYLEGTPLEDLGRELFDLTLQVASGRRSVGEKAGHSQVSLWRNWQQTDGSNLARLQNARRPRVDVPIRLKPPDSDSRLHFDGIRTPGGWVTHQIGLILPTSLCSSQIARLLAQRLTHRQAGGNSAVSRFVALPHTEGCGCSGGQTRQLYSRTLLGHLTHPTVAAGLFLEHGCEATHNDYMTGQLTRMGGDVEDYGKASIQLDGGIEKVGHRVESWFQRALSDRSAPRRQAVGVQSLRMAVLTSGRPAETACRTLSSLVQRFVHAGATIVIPEGDILMESPAWREILVEPDQVAPTLVFGEKARASGLQIMEAATDHGVELLTGLGATGAEILLAWVGREPLPGHVMVPTLQVSSADSMAGNRGQDLDLMLTGPPDSWEDRLSALVLDLASGRYTPVLQSQGNVDFQITRGPLGVSL